MSVENIENSWAAESSVSERLIRASDKLISLSGAVIKGPWVAENAPNGFSPMVVADGCYLIADTHDKPDLGHAKFISTMSPELAIHIANWLGNLGMLLKEDSADCGDLGFAMRIADEILRGDSE